MTAPTIPDALGTPAERVGRGGGWLDVDQPGWWKTTDLDRMDVASWYLCPAGQALGRYHVAQISTDEAIALGFDVPQAAVAFVPEAAEEGRDVAAWDRAFDEGYAELTDLWRELIEQRREEWSDAA